MTTPTLRMRYAIRRLSLPLYFVSAFTITWSLILLVAAERGFDPAAIQLSDGMLIFGCMLLGPSASSLGLTALLEGKPGLRALFARMRPQRLGAGWYALICLTIPLLSGMILAALAALVAPAYRPELSLARLGMGVVLGGLAGFIEESGWTGFALPRLQARYSPLVSGLVLGLLWATWHGMADWWGNRAAFGSYWFINFIVYWIIPLSAYRMLMAWMYHHTHSLFAAQLMHMCYTGTLVAISPALGVTQALLWEALLAAGLWAGVVVVLLSTRWRVHAQAVTTVVS